MKAIIFPILTMFFGVSFGQTLIPEAENLRKAYEALVADTSNIELKTEYVNSFPSDSKIFIAIFHTRTFDQLYSVSYKYIDLFGKLAKDFPNEVLNKCIDIGKDLTYDADAISHLQHLSVSLASQYVFIFVDKFKTLETSEQNALINFYADVENHNAFTIYQKLIDELDANGFKEISRRFEIARSKRKQHNDH